MSTDSSAKSSPSGDKFAPYDDDDDLEGKAILTWKLASFYLETARPEKAVAHLRWIVDTTRNEECRDAALRMLRFLYGCPETGVPALDDELDLLTLLWDMGNAFLGRGNQQPGLLCLLRLLDISSDQEKRAECFLLLGIECEKSDDYEGAIDLYRRGIECEPREVRTRYFLHNNLGYCFNQLGRHDDAERMCQAAIEIDPERHNAYKNLGQALEGRREFPEAALLYLCAAFTFPHDPRSVRHLEELLSNHRKEVEEAIPDVARQLAAAIEARQRQIQ